VIRNGDSDQAPGFSKVDVPVQAWDNVFKMLYQTQTYDHIPWGVLGRILELKQVGMNDLGIETGLLTSLPRLNTPLLEVVDTRGLMAESSVEVPQVLTGTTSHFEASNLVALWEVSHEQIVQIPKLWCARIEGQRPLLDKIPRPIPVPF
jgi:hypothetical protein